MSVFVASSIRVIRHQVIPFSNSYKARINSFLKTKHDLTLCVCNEPVSDGVDPRAKHVAIDYPITKVVVPEAQYMYMF